MPTRVLKDWRHKGGKKPPGVVDCTRPGKWGNPFRDGGCDPVELFREWAESVLQHDPRWLDPLRSAKGLACYCKPGTPCHVDVYLELIERTKGK